MWVDGLMFGVRPLGVAGAFSAPSDVLAFDDGRVGARSSGGVESAHASAQEAQVPAVTGLRVAMEESGSMTKSQESRPGGRWTGG